MTQRGLVSMLALTVLIVVAAAPLAAQSGYKAPRTAWGVPDLQGIYMTTSGVPLQRPENLGSKEFFTEEELAARAEAARNRGPRDVGVHYDNNQFGLSTSVTGSVPSNRTSIISGPTGRIPEMIPEAVARVAAAREERNAHQFDGPEYRGIAERCIYWGHEGPPMRPVGYNGNVQIVQGPGYVAVMHEMIHSVHVIPTDGRAHVDSKVRGFFGDSVGHWEGDTLVVDTVNFNDMPPVGNGATRNVHVTERFTRTGPDTITYQFTVSDPATWEESWSGEFPLGRTEGPIYEYACQEGNYGMAGILSGARAEDKRKAEAAAAAASTPKE